VDGEMHLWDRPGLGLAFDEGFCKAHRVA
jgi:L-alanine-DL-glutamate epimerase-like enolase superfamily enzyme